jgi:hypothetical protein
MIYGSNRIKVWRRADTCALVSIQIKFVKNMMSMYHVICYTLVFQLYFLELKILILEFEMIDAKI